MEQSLDLDVGPSPPEDQPANKEVNIVLAGKSGAGKSTLFYNLIGEKKKVPLSAKPVTKEKDSKPIERNGVTINLIDTQGFIVSKMSVKDVEKKFDLLIYCIPVSPGAKFHDFNPEIMKKLQSIYGKDVWKHCVIAFTFSNLALDRALSDCEEKMKGNEVYMKYITDYAEEFEKELQDKLRVKDMHVQTCFTLDTGHPQVPKEIPAIPTGFNIKDEVLPCKTVDKDCKFWTDKVIIEMIKKCRDDKKLQLAKFKYGYERAKEILEKLGKTVAAGGVGGVALGVTGGAVGACVGIPGGPPTMILGATAGSGVGLFAGAVLGGAGMGGHIITQEIKEKMEKKIKK